MPPGAPGFPGGDSKQQELEDGADGKVAPFQPDPGLPPGLGMYGPAGYIYPAPYGAQQIGAGLGAGVGRIFAPTDTFVFTDVVIVF